MIENSKYNKNLVLTVVFLITAILPIFIFAQQPLQKLAINPLNRALIFLKTKPRYSSNLSEDKLKITLTLDNVIYQDNVRQPNSQGIISDVVLERKNKSTLVNILLREKRGYTANWLPFSNALMIEVFQWDKLTPAEDSYRNGLLALETGNNTMKNYLKKSSDMGNPNASAFLGLMQLQSGDNDNAFASLLLAAKNNTNIADVYGGLYQLYHNKNDKDNADRYLKLFKDKSGISNVDFVSQNEKFGSSQSDNEPSSLLSEMNIETQNSNTNQTVDSTDTKKIDSAKYAKHDTLGVAKSPEPPKVEPSNFNIPRIVIVAGIPILAAAIMIFIYYLRWRKNQLAIMRQKTKEKFRKDLVNAKKERASDKKKKSDKGGLIDRTDEDEDGNPIPKKTKPPVKRLPKTYMSTNVAPEDDSPKVVLQDNATKLQSFLDNYIKENEGPLVDENPNINININPNEEQTTSNTKRPVKKNDEKYSPQVELALHLSDKQKQQKKEAIDNLSKETISLDDKKLDKIAEKLGIEKGSLETKQQIDNIESNESLLAKLAGKFGVDKKE